MMKNQYTILLCMGLLGGCGGGRSGLGFPSPTPGTGTDTGGSTSGGSTSGGSTSSGGTTGSGGMATGAGKVTGTVAGISLTPASAVYATGVIQGLNVVIIKIAQRADVCALLTANASARNSANITAVLVNTDGQGHSVAPAAGTYEITAGNTPITQPNAEAQFFATDGTCGERVSDASGVAQSGTFMITSTPIDGTTPLTGSFAMVVGDQGDNVSGTFMAVPCPGILAAATNDAPKACQ